MEFWNKLDDAAKGRVLSGLGILGDASAMQPDMTGIQKGLATFLQTLNLFATGFGNVAQGYKDITYQPIKP